MTTGKRQEKETIMSAVTNRWGGVILPSISRILPRGGAR